MTPARLRLSLPPDWWSLPLDQQTDPVPAIDAHLARRVPGVEGEAWRAQLRPEWLALTGAVRALGARLFAGGTAVDDETGKLVAASLLVVHGPPVTVLRASDLRLTAVANAAAARAAGAAADVVDLAMGPASRAVRFDEIPLPEDTVVVLMRTDYVIPTPDGGTWTLVFTTPALLHAELLGDLFDTIASSLGTAPAA